MSARRSAFLLFSMRAADSADTSSMPAVSRKTTGPMGKSSIVFSTTSVVVPGSAEVMATSCPASMFRNEDLPTFMRPAMPM